MNVRVEELAKKKLDFLSWKFITPDIKAMLGDPEKHSDLDVLRYFLGESEFCRILYKNPADFEMLEGIYYGDFVRCGHSINGNIDGWISKQLPAQALRDRLNRVTDWLADYLPDQITKNPYFKITDFGSGPGPYAFETIKKMGKQKMHWDCLDLDRLALATGKIRAKDSDLSEIVTFRSSNFMHHFPTEENKADFGLVIGIICGMSIEDAVMCLQGLKFHLKNHGEILVATLLTKSFEEDPWLFRLLCNVLEWPLKPKTINEVQSIFESAGWNIKSILSERENGNGEYAIVHASVK